MTIVMKTPDQITSDMVTSWAAFVGITPVLSSGDGLLAIFQAAAIEIDFVQQQVQAVLALTRAQTCVGADLDAWMMQFFFTRLPAAAASGPVTLGKLVPAVTSVLVQPGSVIQTVGGAIQYQVVVDTAQSAWSATSGAYVLLPGQSSMSVTVQAMTAGFAQNVIANQLAQIGSTITGIDTVTNGSAIASGVDAETDAAFLVRFVLYIGTLAKATSAAVLAAALSVQQGIQVSIAESVTPTGTAQLGCFTVFVDNGTGSPPTSLLTSVYNAVNATRALGIQPYVSAPTIVTAIIGLSVRVATGYTAGTVLLSVQAALVAAVALLPQGGTLYVSNIEAAALAVPGVVSVKPANTTINTLQVDLTVGSSSEIRTSAANITVGIY